MELGEATVNRILHEKSCSEEEFLKELLNSRNNEDIVNHLKDSNRPREDFQVRKSVKKMEKIMFLLPFLVCCSPIDLQQ